MIFLVVILRSKPAVDRMSRMKFENPHFPRLAFQFGFKRCVCWVITYFSKKYIGVLRKIRGMAVEKLLTSIDLVSCVSQRHLGQSGTSGTRVQCYNLLSPMEKIVFTNGCFDILHPGHIDLLTRARALGTRLVVGINSDRSVRSIKGDGRPLQDEEARKAVLAGLSAVDEVIIFDELTPENLIKQLKPDVLVKGGDWKENEIIGADFVKANGGEVRVLPLKDGFSTSKIVAKADLGSLILDLGSGNGNVEDQRSKIKDQSIDKSIAEHLRVFEDLKGHSDQIAECARMIFDTFRAGHKVLICGNGGSAADSQHLAAEFAGRYETERRAYPAIALTTDTSALTALANDYGFERVFARQVEALAAEGDCLIAISTSGNSPNVIAAVMEARAAGCKVIGLTGAKGKKLASLCDNVILVPSERTARIQEGHITIAHIWCEMVDQMTLDL